jgi:Tol biopolymer transport system component
VAAVEPAGKRRAINRWWLRWGFGTGLVLAGVVLGYVKRNAPESERVRPFTSLPGYERKPAFSPDGQVVAFGWAGPGQTTMRIYVQKLGSDNPAPVTSGVANDVAAAWSPDGSTIAFFRQGEHNQWDVMTVPAGGGQQRKVAEVVARISTELNVTWDPDSRYLLTSSRRDSTALPSLVRVSLESGQVTPVSGSLPGDFFPNLSPNGRILGFLREYSADVADLMTAPWTANGIDSGRTRKIAPERSLISGFDWLRDGRGLVFSSERGGAAQLWRANLDGDRGRDTGFPVPPAQTRAGAH